MRPAAPSRRWNAAKEANPSGRARRSDHRLGHPAPPRGHRRRRWARRCCAPPTRRSSTRAATSRPPSATPRAGWSPRPSTCRSTSGAMPWAVQSVREFFGDRIRPGDVYLLNDPYHGNNHLPDLTAFVPVFAERPARCSGRSTARTRATSAAPPTAPTTRARPRSGRRASASPPLKLYDAGELRDDVLQMIATNVRHPRDFLGDLRGHDRLGPGRRAAAAARCSTSTALRRRSGRDRRDPRRRRAPGARLHRGVEGRRVPRRGGPRRRRPRLRGHPHPRHGHQARAATSTVDLTRLPPAGDRLRQLVVSRT